MPLRCDPINKSNFSHVLCLSSFTFIIPTILLFYKGGLICYLLGSLVLTLMFTSLVYHATHIPLARACDVFIILVTTLTAFIITNISLIMNKMNVYFVISNIALISICIISYNSKFHFINANNDGIIKIQYHIIMHILAAFAMTLIPLGLP